MDWYVVVKTINGHRYRYRQKTWREGKRVRTRSEYIGPLDDSSSVGDLSGATTLTLPFPKTRPTRESAFDSKITAAALLALTDRDALAEAWEYGWSATRRGKNLVHKDGRVVRLLTTLKVVMTDETSGAFYSPNLDIVNIPPERCFRDKDRQTATQAYHVVLFHELVHWTMDERRLGRDVSDYAKEELVAELGAIMLMNHFRLEVGNMARHAKYFQIWLSRTDDSKAALRHAKREAERAVKWIIKRGKIDP
jgi:hypothetical protein